MSDDRKQRTDDSGKKVRGWEGEKVRKHPPFESHNCITFNLRHFTYQPALYVPPIRTNQLNILNQLNKLKKLMFKTP